MKIIRLKIFDSILDIEINSDQLYNYLLSEIKHKIKREESIKENKKCKLLIIPPWKLINNVLQEYEIHDNVYIDCVEKTNSNDTLIASSLSDRYIFKWYISKFIIKILYNDCIAIHASSVKINNKSILFVGNKDSGKSTLSLALLLWENASFVSDDITLLSPNKSKINVTGLFNGLNINNNEVNNIRVCRRSNIYERSNYKKRLTINDEYTLNDAIIDYIIFPKTYENKSTIKKISTQKGVNNLSKYIMSNEKDGINMELLSEMNFKNIVFFEMLNNSDINNNVKILLDEIEKY
ncbi:MAG: hypothetical protein LBU51_04065 [Bacteroidales bacterium]|nr:hypothetical protein [Bacteroidales bacterium]